MATDQVWSREEDEIYTSKPQMSNFRSEVDHRSLDPSRSLSAVNIINWPSITQPTRNMSWSDTWPLLLPFLRLSIELEPLDERVCGKRSYSSET
jgi:hypothetical protein